MPWLYCLLYSTVFILITVCIVLFAQQFHPVIFAIILIVLVLIFTGTIRLGEWFRLRPDRQPHEKDE